MAKMDRSTQANDFAVGHSLSELISLNHQIDDDYAVSFTNS